MIKKFLNKNKSKKAQLFGKSYGCGACGMRFKYRDELVKHAQDVHDKKTTYLCITCDESYENESSFMLHMAREHRV